MIVSPWGEILAELKEESTDPRIAVADIDLEQVTRIRREMPLNRRTYVYTYRFVEIEY
jgi:predicted amidohydrolase